MVWYQGLMRFTSTLLLLGSLFYMGRRMQAGLGIGGGGGKGVHGIFNVGKAMLAKYIKMQKIRSSSKMLLAVIRQIEKLWSLRISSRTLRNVRIGSENSKSYTVGRCYKHMKDLFSKSNCRGSDVPFLSVYGSDFSEMFVGVGTSMVRNVLQEARQCAPCVVFTDEINATGQTRGRRGFLGANDEHESTLNQLCFKWMNLDQPQELCLLVPIERGCAVIHTNRAIVSLILGGPRKDWGKGVIL